MTPQDFYFELCREVSGTFYLITPKAYYDREGCLSDESGLADAILPSGFCELAESTYEYNGTPENGRQLLIDLGMKEISFGFQKGEPSNKEDTLEDGEYQAEYDELDELLKEDDIEYKAFDYKNLSTDKLLRHMRVMIDTEAFEEAAKIRDELNSRETQ